MPPSRIEVRASSEEKQALVRNAQLLGISQSALIRALIKLPLSTCRSVVHDEDARLLVDDVTLARCATQLRRAGYNIDYSLHALNTLLAKPSLHDKRKFELLRQASEESMRAAKTYAEIRDTFAALFPSADRILFLGQDRED